MNNQKNIKSTVMLVPATVTHGATATANLDCLDAGSAEILVTLAALAGAGTAPSSIKIFESNDTVVTNFAELTALSTGAAAVGASESVRFFVDRSNGNRKRYLRVELTVPAGSTNSNIPVAAIGFLSKLDEAPSGTAEYGSTVVKEL